MKSQTALLYFCSAMNIILIEKDERFFPRYDERCVHIRKILKKKAGEFFSAGEVNGPEGTARIERLDESGLSFSFTAERPSSPLHPLILLVGFPRPIQLKRLLRDVSSLGVASVLLSGTDLGEKSYRESNLVDRGSVDASLREGAVQAASTAIPSFSLCDSIDDALRTLPDAAQRIVLDVEGAVCPLAEAEGDTPTGERPLVLAIGSERGWSARERELFRLSGFTVCSLGSRILRTETACTAAVSVALAKFRLW